MRVILIVLLILLFSSCTLQYFDLTTTGYYPGPECCAPWADGFTYTGAKASKGCIAIDPHNGPFKLGQRVYVVGYGFGTCNDIGGAIKGWKADLCFDTLEEAQKWEKRLTRIYILK